MTRRVIMRPAMLTSRGSASSWNSLRMSVLKAFVGYSAAG